MIVPIKFQLFFLLLIFPCLLFASINDTAKHGDTLLLADSLIHKISIKCSALGSMDQNEPKEINSQSEFNDFFINNCTTSFDIDFNKETLLWFPTKAGGCDTKFLPEIKIIGKKVIYNVIIEYAKGKAECAVMILSNNSIVVPKIDDTYDVEFIKTDLYDK